MCASGTVVVVVVVVGFVVSYTAGFVPEIILDDLCSLLNHWNIRLLSIVQSDNAIANDQMERNQFDASSLKRFMFRNEIRINFVKCVDIGETNPIGALFFSVTDSCDIQKMINRSEISRPLLIYSTNDSPFPELLQHHHIPFDSSVNLISRDSQDPERQRLSLTEAYHLQDNATGLVINVLGSTQADQHGKSVWNLDTDSNIVVRRANLHGSQIKIVYPAVLFSNVDASGLTAVLTGGRDIVNLVAFCLNFSTVPVVLREVNLVGELGADGNWTGSVGMLQRRDADLSLIAITSKSPLLREVLNLALPHATGNYRMYLRKPEFSYSLQSMARSFRIDSWVALAVMLLIFAIALTIMSHVSHVHASWVQPPCQPYALSESLMVLLGDFCIKGWARVPASESGRIFMVSSVCLGFLTNTLFVMQLQAGITAKTAPMPFRSFEEMLLTQYIPLMFEGSAPHAHTLLSEQGVWKEVKDLMLRNPGSTFKDFSKVMSRVCCEEVAILAWPAIMSSALDNAKCKIVDTRNDFSVVASFPTSKRFRFRSAFNYGILRAKESGLINQIESHLRMRPIEETVVFQVIEIKDVVPFLTLYVAALCYAIFVFLVEVTFFCIIVKSGRSIDIY